MRNVLNVTITKDKNSQPKDTGNYWAAAVLVMTKGNTNQNRIDVECLNTAKMAKVSVQFEDGSIWEGDFEMLRLALLERPNILDVDHIALINATVKLTNRWLDFRSKDSYKISDLCKKHDIDCSGIYDIELGCAEYYSYPTLKNLAAFHKDLAKLVASKESKKH